METPKDKMVKLISSDGYEFIVDYKAACVSKTIRNMLTAEGCFIESEKREIVLHEISGNVLEEVCRYFYYKLQNQAKSKTIQDFKVKNIFSNCEYEILNFRLILI